ncbi:hypothetical protein U1Q18_018665 [Sarracenia purpurea var. burkii]
MAAASSFQSSTTLRCLSAQSHNKRPLVPHLRANLLLPRQPSPPPVVTFSRRRSNANPSIYSSKKKEPRFPHNEVNEEDDLDGDAVEALFSLLEEDLKNDDPSLDDGDYEIGEEDLAKLEHELEEASGDDNELLGAFDRPVEDEIDNKDEEDDDSDYDENLVKLKNWQLRRLAYALKNGRRKTSIKNLAADVCLDRATVLQLLRDPPPNLLLLSAALPDKPSSLIPERENKPLQTVSSETAADVEQDEAKTNLPVHVMLSSWSARKRLKKVQVETLERVYARTKRPTNAMISSIVHVTNLPRKRVVKWFEDKRAEDGVPNHRPPYHRSSPETVFNS